MSTQFKRDLEAFGQSGEDDNKDSYRPALTLSQVALCKAFRARGVRWKSAELVRCQACTVDGVLPGAYDFCCIHFFLLSGNEFQLVVPLWRY